MTKLKSTSKLSLKDRETLTKAITNSEELTEILTNKVSSIDDLVGKNGIISELIKPTVQRIMEAEMEEHLGYSKHAATGNNTGNSRNGSYGRNLKTSTGPVGIDVPRDRNGQFDSQFLDKHKTTSPEFEAKVTSLYAYGNSTADIVDFIDETYGVEISPGLVSNITNKITELAQAWQQRPLQAMYPIIYLDAIHLKVRDKDSHKVINKAVYIILAYDLDGRKEILGHYIGRGGEGAKFWLQVITDLKNRGLQDVLIACVDGLSGFDRAINSVYPKTNIQRCIVHAIRNSLRYIPHKLKSEFMDYLRPVYKSDTKEQAETAFAELKQRYNEKYPMAIAVWDNNLDQLLEFMDYSKEIRKIIYTTNAIESYNSVLRKYTKNKRSFVSDEALAKVLYLANQKAVSKWDKSLPNWPSILNQFAIHFDERLPM